MGFLNHLVLYVSVRVSGLSLPLSRSGMRCHHSGDSAWFPCVANSGPFSPHYILAGELTCAEARQGVLLLLFPMKAS